MTPLVERANAIIHGQRSITAETALLFSRFFGNSAEFWMGLQSQYDLEIEQDRLADRLDQVPEYSVGSQPDRVFPTVTSAGMSMPSLAPMPQNGLIPGKNATMERLLRPVHDLPGPVTPR